MTIAVPENSCIKQFYSALLAVEHTHVEGTKRETQDKAKWFELRVDGPVFNEQSHRQFICKVDVNIACSVVGEDDAYALDRLSGKAASLFSYSIECKKYGTGVGDDDSVIGCLSLIPGPKETIAIANFGLVRFDTELYQSTVEGHYRMHFKVEE